ncbi:thymidine kinase [Aerococcus urinaehominis]|uniref:Thymidine kinase n=1 Tax=Aerococcus urinaehominis TaxID=128944 RepID=A0A0X8FK23_9LACT|nr:thymidine kinase [Aerococcus urinaehominis]AMB98750.1 thymidine kinase [Aerococcus urinaehominis]SDM14187.1 thymidine kinase [Aerococcus urinaehominis]
MAQLYFRYGAMNSGKSIELMKVAHNYEEQDKKVLVFTSATDNRSGQGIIASRVGWERPAYALSSQDDLFDLVSKKSEDQRVSCVLIDEAQFLSRAQIIQAARVVDILDIPVMCFGLKNNFLNHLFEGSKTLLEFADKIEEIKTICWYCERKATMNMRIVDGRPVYEGDEIQIGGNESYLPVCRRHYMQGYPDGQ